MSDDHFQLSTSLMFKAQTHSPSLKPDQTHISLAKHNALSSVISDEMHMTMNRSYTYYVLFAILSLPRDREYASSSLPLDDANSESIFITATFSCNLYNYNL